MPSQVMSVTGPHDAQEDPRVVLGRFLRTRREQISPGDLGFPSTGRRRTPGLRREEVAVAAGLSVTWYTYLEQGRGMDVSPGVLDSIARALQLSEDERRYMHLLMFGHAPPSVPLRESVPVHELIQSVITSMNSYPYPVYEADHACNVLSWNRAFTEWYDDFGSIPRENQNLMHWMFSSARDRRVFTNWETVARDLVARWRMEFTPEPFHKSAKDLADRFKNEFPLFREWWNDHTVLEHRITVRAFRRPGNENYALRVLPLSTVYHDSPVIFWHIPHDIKSSLA
jgi:transcriptional regulator with XRE-family HTH domain